MTLETGQFLADLVMQYTVLMRDCNFVAARDKLREISSMSNMLADSLEGLPNHGEVSS